MLPGRLFYDVPWPSVPYHFVRSAGDQEYHGGYDDITEEHDHKLGIETDCGIVEPAVGMRYFSYWGFTYPQIGWFKRNPRLKWMILGYLHLWNPPINGSKTNMLLLAYPQSGHRHHSRGLTYQYQILHGCC